MATREVVPGRPKKREANRSVRRSGRRRTPSPSGPGSGHPELPPEGKLYYRIGEVARITGVKPHVLRYWETEFRWMAPPKSRSKQRLYRRKDIEMILAIKKLLYEERYTIAGARQRLRELGLARASGTADEPLGALGSAEERQNPGDDDSDGVRRSYRRNRGELMAIREML